MAQPIAKKQEIAKYGPYGSELQENYDFQLAEGERIVEVIAWTGDVVDNFEFLVAKPDGTSRTVSFGGKGADHSEATLAPCDYLTGVSGIYGDYYGRVVIGKLTFHSKLHSDGLLSVGNGSVTNPQNFSSPINGRPMVGVFGRANEYIESIGVYINEGFKPCN